MTAVIHIGILGCTGRVGKLLAQELLSGRWSDSAVLAGGTVRPRHPLEGTDIATLCGLAPCGIAASADAEGLCRKSDVLVDFTRPDPTLRHAELAARYGKPFVTGTTGLDAAQEQALHDLAGRIPLLYAANMSVGVNVLLALVEQAAARLGPEWDIEILETHHRNKVDAPSGTALAIGKAAAAGRGVPLQDNADWARHGETGARQSGRIGFAVRRGGDVVGEHTAGFYADGERIELSHIATSRALFARGAIRAALWVKDQEPGLYSMRDTLGL